MKQNNKERFHSKSMADSYNQMCQFIVPGYNFMQDTMINTLKFENIQEINLIRSGSWKWNINRKNTQRISRFNLYLFRLFNRIYEHCKD